jgi:hypothetical protein
MLDKNQGKAGFPKNLGGEAVSDSRKRRALRAIPGLRIETRASHTPIISLGRWESSEAALRSG